jgi:hypothetical protein
MVEEGKRGFPTERKRTWPLWQWHSKAGARVLVPLFVSHLGVPDRRLYDFIGRILYSRLVGCAESAIPKDLIPIARLV